MSTSLDERLDRAMLTHYKKPALIAPAVAVVLLSLVALRSVVVANSTYQHKDYSSCATKGSPYLQAAADNGDPQAQRLLKEQRQACRTHP